MVPLGADGDGAEAAVAAEAAAIAAYVRGEVASGERSCGDFLVLTRLKKRLGVYAGAFDDLEIPVEASGAGLFCKSAEVRALALLLRALADPQDAVALVGVLRGPMWGLSDPELFRFRQAGGRFELNAPLPEAEDAEASAVLDAQYGPRLAVMRQLREMWRQTRRMPLGAALGDMLDSTDWLALAGTTPGGARAGHLLQAIDEVRQVVESGGGLADAADALNEEDESTESEALPLEPGRRGVVRLMNLHKAKGLEAPVVILADPLHDYTFPTTVRVVREGMVARGYLRMVRKSGRGFGETTLAQPVDWESHEAEEKRYIAAERLRLLYVAGTRAEDLLIVCRTGDAAKDKAWRDFSGYLDDQPEVVVPSAPRPSKKLDADVSPKARSAAAAARAVRHEGVRTRSWDVTSPAAEKSRLTSAERAKRVATEPGAAAAVPDTPSHRADAGAAWGTLVHGLLEHAMRYPGASHADLARLAQWLTVEQEDVRPFIDEAIGWVDDVRGLPFWLEASASGECHVEVPFAVRVPAPGAGVGANPGALAQDGDPACLVLRGIIDLVHRTGEGWRILDYKSDQIEGIADLDTELRRRYGAQLGQYTVAWERGSGGSVVAAELVALRAKRAIGSEGGPAAD